MALQQQMLDTLRQHENEQQNLMAQQPFQIKSRLDELKDQAIEQQLAKSKMKSDAAFSAMLQEQLSGMSATNQNNPRRFNQNRDGADDPRRPGTRPGPGGGPNGSVVGATQGGGDYPTGSAPSQGGGSPANMEQRIREAVSGIRGNLNFEEMPYWLRQLYSQYPEGDRWQGLVLQNAPAWKRQTFRRTQPYVQGLYEASQ
jgi:hypothetical protein